MKTKTKSQEWKDFERLVAIIERHLGPEGAIIKSPDHIPDKITGEMREVDASIRYQVGSVPILITIECRRRSAKQDTRWIEQIARKRDDIGASATIAVSSSGFSKPAIKKARYHEIETRLLHEISERAIFEWAKQIDIVLFRSLFNLGNLRILFKNATHGEKPELHPDIKREYAKGDADYKFIRRLEDDMLISIADLLREAEGGAGTQVYDQPKQDITISVPPKSTAVIHFNLQDNLQVPSVFKGVPIGAEPVTKLYAWNFEPNEATIETERGPMEIEYLDVELNIIIRVYPTNVGQLLSYDNDQGSILNIEKRKIEGGKGFPTIEAIISGNRDSNNR